MNLFTAHRFWSKEAHEDRICPRCEEGGLRLVQTILDPRKGKTIRIFECQCGECIWDD